MKEAFAMYWLIALGTVVLLAALLLVSGYVKASPDTAYIISGLRRTPKVLIGKAGIKIPFFEKKETWLLDLNQAILEKLLGFLKLDSTVRLTEDYIREGNPLYTDFRNAIHPKTARRHTEIEFVFSPYRQTFSDRFPFTPNLSILDLLFCCGPESREKLLTPQPKYV